MIDIICTAVIILFKYFVDLFYKSDFSHCYEVDITGRKKREMLERSSKKCFTSESQGHGGMGLEITDGGIFSMT